MANKVLIVDDSQTMRKILQRDLKHAGAMVSEFREAADGQQGLDALRRNRIDLILADIDVAKINGADFVAALENRFGEDAPPVVVVANDGGELRQAEEQGALAERIAGVLEPPFTPEKIQDVLGPHLH